LSNAVRPTRHHAFILAPYCVCWRPPARAGLDSHRHRPRCRARTPGRIRLQALDLADAKNADLLKTFNEVLWNDLDNAGIFDLVSKSFLPAAGAGTALRDQLLGVEFPAANTSMLAFGNLGAASGKVTVQGWLYMSRMKSRRRCWAAVHRQRNP